MREKRGKGSRRDREERSGEMRLRKWRWDMGRDDI